MQKVKRALTWFEALALVGILSLLSAQGSEAAWTVDLAGLTTDVTTIGATLLALTVVIFGFKVVRRMVGR